MKAVADWVSPCSFCWREKAGFLPRGGELGINGTRQSWGNTGTALGSRTSCCLLWRRALDLLAWPSYWIPPQSAIKINDAEDF